MATDDRKRPINLLDRDESGDFVGERLGSERKESASLFLQRIGESQRAPNAKRDFRNRVFFETPELVRPFEGDRRFPFFIEEKKNSSRGEGFLQSVFEDFGLFRLDEGAGRRGFIRDGERLQFDLFDRRKRFRIPKIVIDGLANAGGF